MKKWRIEYRPKYTPTPMSYWVHKQPDSEAWYRASKFDPPLPKAIPCKGYPVLVVNAFGIELEFASVEEAEHFLNVISRKNLPTSLQLSRDRVSNHGPNSHWLSRLPARLKPWSKRERLVPLIKESIANFKKIYA